MKKHFSAPVTKILKKMSSMVGLKYDPDFFREEEYYLKKSWTSEQQEQFIDWLSEQLKTDKQIKRLFGFNPSQYLSKTKREKIALYFTGIYGWMESGDHNV